MNKAQVAYATKRIDDLLALRLKTITAKHTKPAKRLTAAERAKLVRSGAVTLRADVRTIESYTDVTAVFDFSAHEWGDKVDSEAIEKAIRPLREEAQKIKDRINLGDADTALAAVEAFAQRVGGANG